MEFRQALKVIRKWEGGESNDPRDPGGHTRWGITLKLLRALRIDYNRDGIVDGKDLRAMTEDQAADIYATQFWNKCHCGELPAGLRLAVFDCGVNQGTGRAARFLQKAARVKADGAIGPVTLAAVGNATPRALLTEFMARRAVHYSTLAIVAIYGRGWFRRLFDVHFLCAHEIRHART